MFTYFKHFVLLTLIVSVTFLLCSQTAMSSQSESITLDLGVEKGVNASVVLQENVALSKTNITAFDVNLTLLDSKNGSIYQSGRAALRYTSDSKYGSDIIILESRQGYFKGGPLVIAQGSRENLEIVCVLSDGVSRKYSTDFSLKR